MASRLSAGEKPSPESQTCWAELLSASSGSESHYRDIKSHWYSAIIRPNQFKRLGNCDRERFIQQGPAEPALCDLLWREPGTNGRSFTWRTSRSSGSLAVGWTDVCIFVTSCHLCLSDWERIISPQSEHWLTVTVWSFSCSKCCQNWVLNAIVHPVTFNSKGS